MQTPRIEQLITAGNQDPAGPPTHENNVWLIGDAAEVIVIDPAHDANGVMEAVGDRQVTTVLLTHGHWDHIRQAVDFARLAGRAEVFLSEADLFLWQAEHGDAPFKSLEDQAQFDVAGITLTAIATPGHTPGSTCFSAPELNTLFSGDTLFEGGPGATAWDYSSFDTILDSISNRLFPLGDETTVNTGHGPSTTIGAERPDFEAWRARGW